jgi:hypothetical protein
MGDMPQLALSLYLYGAALANSCDFRSCQEMGRRSLEIAERTGDATERAYARCIESYSSSMLAKNAVELAEQMGRELIADCQRCGDQYILNQAHFTIAWDYACRGLTNDAREWAWQLMAERQARRAVGMAHWILRSRRPIAFFQTAFSHVWDAQGLKARRCAPRTHLERIYGRTS